MILILKCVFSINCLVSHTQQSVFFVVLNTHIWVCVCACMLVSYQLTQQRAAVCLVCTLTTVWRTRSPHQQPLADTESLHTVFGFVSMGDVH